MTYTSHATFNYLMIWLNVLAHVSLNTLLTHLSGQLMLSIKQHSTKVCLFGHVLY